MALTMLQGIGKETGNILAPQLKSIQDAMMSNGFNKDLASRLSIEVMGVWIGEAAKGQFYDMAEAIAKSPRIQAILLGKA